MSWIGLCLGTGTISASFQDKGKRPSRREAFMISMMDGAKRSAFSFRSHPGIPSGPCALAGLIEHNFLKIENADIGEKSSFIVLLEDTKSSPLNRLWVSGSKTSIGAKKAVLIWFARSAADRHRNLSFASGHSSDHRSNIDFI